MKIKLMTLCATLLVSSVFAEDAKPVKLGSPEFERMKSLVGTWTGKVDMGQGPVEMTKQYRLIAGGSVVEEVDFPDTSNEMVTMYYDKDGKLALTHYCIFGNRPQMFVKAADAKSITFDFDNACGINPQKDCHMHAMKVVFVDAETITASCRGMMDGKDMPEHETTLKRVKP